MSKVSTDDIVTEVHALRHRLGPELRSALEALNDAEFDCGECPTGTGEYEALYRKAKKAERKFLRLLLERLA